MKPIKKFSTEMNQPKSILESIDSKALTELIKGMGFNNIQELKKEKNLLSKLEALLKEVNPISEDDAKDIEDKLNKKAEPKSLEDHAGKKEPEVVVGSVGEVAEEEEIEEEEIEEEIEEEKAEEEIEEEQAEEEIEEEQAEEDSSKTSRKIMTFEDFIQVKNNKNDVSESDADDNDEEFNESSVNLDFVIKSFDKFITEAVVDNGPALTDEETDNQGIIIPIKPGDGSKTSSDIEDKLNAIAEPENLKDEEGEEFVTNDQEITQDAKTAEDEPESHGTVVVKESAINEEEVESDEQFQEYAFTVLQNAFGDDFDEAKAQEMVDGLISKYSGDYGAMVGAVKASLSESEE